MTKRSQFLALAACAASLAIPAQLLAHHSFASEFDAKQPIKLHGVVTKVAWTNPHAYIHIEVEGDKGDVQEWALEMGSPNGLMRNGWTRDTLGVGTEVYIAGTRARDGSNKGNVRTVVLAESCKRLFAGSSEPGAEKESNAAPTTEKDCGL
ncbi:MAG: hypothetical protein LBE59_09650 [Nevskiaceae bacterium]|nr:hypothetical protein [Nevskiaceae bacterium]